MKTYTAVENGPNFEGIPGPDFEINYVPIPDVEEMKQFFGPIEPEERAWRSQRYFDALLQSPRSKLGIGEHDRAEAYVFGNESFPQETGLPTKAISR